MAVYIKGSILQDEFTGPVLHCRTCFTTNSNGYNPLSTTMFNCLLECASLQLHESELNSAMVCQSCSQIMETFIKFKNKCHEVDALFKMNAVNSNYTSNNKFDLDHKSSISSDSMLNCVLVKNEPVESEYEGYDEMFHPSCEIKTENDLSEDNADNKEFIYDNNIKTTRKKKTKKKKKIVASYFKKTATTEKRRPPKIPEIIARLNEPRNCKICDFPCLHGRSLINHMNIGHKELKPTFFCREPKQSAKCKNGFKCEEAYVLHIYSRHTTKWRQGEKPVVKSSVPVKIRQKTENVYYEQIRPTKIPELISKMDEPQNCKVCDVECPDVKKLISHYNLAHKNLPRIFVCPKSSHCITYRCEEALILHDYTRHLVKYRLKFGTKPDDGGERAPNEDESSIENNEIKSEENTSIMDTNVTDKTVELKKSKPRNRKSLSKRRSKKDDNDSKKISLSEASELLSKTDEPRKCQFCEIECSNVQLLISHVNSDHTDKELSFVCSNSPHCKSAFRCEEALILHVYSSHLLKKQHQTTGNVSEANIKQDKLDHCNVCGKDRSLIVDFPKHIRDCSDMWYENKECPICKRTIANKYNMRRHMEIHDANRTLPVCNLCGKSFSNLRQHIEKSHLGVHDKKYKCIVCSERFETLSEVVQHRKTVHIDIIESLTYRWECDICGKKYKSHGGLRIHKNLVHTKKVDHECTTCGKLFKLPSFLDEHIRRIHLKEKNHDCKFCGKGFYYFHALKTHMNVHTGEKRHECNICQKKFGRNDYLVSHMKSHAKSKKVA